MEEKELRREFQLLEHDMAFLDSQGCPWESIKVKNQMWILIHDYTVPEGYTEKSVTLALQIPSNYPSTQIDMVYVRPNLVRQDKTPIGATQHSQLIDGNQYQRWSRHRTRVNPWRPDLDDISTHLSLVEEWLSEYGVAS